ncbi:hypothetical protein EHQ05_15440 [Leptospira yasudae]|uniref:Uncharacterized protein n=1 Tax=Leptospira yasudae TaxID=2202201 RepID=A0ABX9M4K5_9LEPT|nr:hypothetical protein [Leptospira yasudae]RHX80611.1 hypothetical protein DLM77_06880 [Leptospira yasudae]TGK24320.1 hypothetical protein EHQ05_15440 [Leptospira yasudae]TGM05892.1 hypothetical protein EHQ86_10785 [Leptospira yasudae]
MASCRTLTNSFEFVFLFIKKIGFQNPKAVSRSVLILVGLLSYSTGLWSTELKYGELLFKCRMEKPRCSSRDVCAIEFYAYPKKDSYLNPFVTLYQGEEKNIKDPEYTFDTKIALPATYERKGEKHLIRVETSEFPLRFVLEIQTNSKKPELASIGLLRENSEDDPIRYNCRALKAGYGS